MKLDQVRQRTENGFKPFVLQLSDDRRVPVPHPDFVAVGPRRIVVIAADDSWSVVEPLLIVSLDSNGSRSRTPPGTAT